jgi:GNAT superfamily N-acetyltransferase
MRFATRTATLADAARLHELHTAAVRQLCAPHYAPDIIDGWLANRTPSGYLQAIERAAIFVVEHAGRIVGFGEADAGFVVACYVEPTLARRGVGSTIMAHALTIARHGHDGPVRVEATLNAAAFYERFGFRAVARSSVQRNDVDIPVVLMERA